jgi:hypothetical protein
LTRRTSQSSPLSVKPPSPSPIPEIYLPIDVTLGKRKVGEEEPGALQEREGAQKLSIRGQHARQRRQHKEPSPLQSVGSGGSSPASASENGLQPSTMKRLKTTADGETPSLLLRMGQVQHLLPGGRGRQGSKSKSPPALQPQRSASQRHPTTGSPDLSLGLSIKGAARLHSRSLLERIQGGGT